MFRRLFPLVLVSSLVSCVEADHDRDLMKVTPKYEPPKRCYTLIIRTDTPIEKVGPILTASREWETASDMAVTFSVRYSYFDESVPPDDLEMRVYTAPKKNSESKSVGGAGVWNTPSTKVPVKSIIWIDSKLSDRMHYLVALHEIGHAVGIANHIDEPGVPSVMTTFVNDFGDHPTCRDRRALCDVWECTADCAVDFGSFLSKPEEEFDVDLQ